MSGKGSTRRPMQITQKQFERNWQKIFGTKKKEKKNAK